CTSVDHLDPGVGVNPGSSSGPPCCQSIPGESSKRPKGVLVVSSCCRDMSSSAQRKRRPSGNSLVSRTKTRRTANSRPLSRRTANASNPAPPTEPIDVLDGTEDGVEEVVDLTCEGSEAAVVDLTTNNDSVLLVDEGPLNDIVSSSYVLSSDEEEDMSTGIDTAITSSVQTSRYYIDPC
ncbi:hypothetical protein XENOCAPTIV_025518, partial [Xenoophorus captivus]